MLCLGLQVLLQQHTAIRGYSLILGVDMEKLLIQNVCIRGR